MKPVKAERVVIKTVPKLEMPFLGIPHDVLSAQTRASLDAMQAQFKAFRADNPLPAKQKKATAFSSS